MASVDAALAKLRSSSDARSSQAAYEALLDAVGNNHAGTYEASALQAIEAAPQLLDAAGPWGCRALLEALIDLRGSFIPEPGQERYEGADLQLLVATRMAELQPSIETAAQRNYASSESARELLALIISPPTPPSP